MDTSSLTHTRSSAVSKNWFLSHVLVSSDFSKRQRQLTLARILVSGCYFDLYSLLCSLPVRILIGLEMLLAVGVIYDFPRGDIHFLFDKILRFLPRYHVSMELPIMVPYLFFTSSMLNDEHILNFKLNWMLNLWRKLVVSIQNVNSVMPPSVFLLLRSSLIKTKQPVHTNDRHALSMPYAGSSYVVVVLSCCSVFYWSKNDRTLR